jgi:hypothetical protein
VVKMRVRIKGRRSDIVMGVGYCYDLKMDVCWFVS